MEKFASMLGDKAGELVEGMVKKALGVEDKDKDKEEKKGGLFSFGDSKKDEDEGGVLSFGGKKKDEDEGSFLSNIFNKDKDDDREKKSGFQGLFSEQEGVSAGGQEGDTAGGGGDDKGQSVGVSDGDLLSDLMVVAEETSRGE